MERTRHDATTYLPVETEAAELSRLLHALEPGRERGCRPKLDSGDGMVIELPDSVFDALLTVARALASHQGVTVVPRDTTLTTQAAADFLGTSRPTLVKLLESGEIPFTKVRRHRRVLLHDLRDYQQRARKSRADSLSAMVEAAEDADMYDATAGSPPPMR